MGQSTINGHVQWLFVCLPEGNANADVLVIFLSPHTAYLPYNPCFKSTVFMEDKVAKATKHFSIFSKNTLKETRENIIMPNLKMILKILCNKTPSQRAWAKPDLSARISICTPTGHGVSSLYALNSDPHWCAPSVAMRGSHSCCRWFLSYAWGQNQNMPVLNA